MKQIQNIEKLRNIGIAAHIDSGKTTLTERILFYCNKIHAIHDVKGKDGIGATMDSMELERERGITIASASTHVSWNGYHINVIDTPGHVDFTIEVERALRVLDGAILVLCAVGGVQSQSITVDRQLKRHKVPNIAFINKCDRTGANPFRVREQLIEKLRHNAVLMQLPIGLESEFEGIIDLVKMKALYFDGECGQYVRTEEIPEQMKKEADHWHEELINAASMYCDTLAESYLEGSYTEEQVYHALRKATVNFDITPVFLGSAHKNKGIQPLLDAVLKFLPCPADIENYALDQNNNEEKVLLKPDAAEKTVALAFKLEDGRYGQLTYIRIYQGTIKRGDELCNFRTGKNFRIGRLIRMHADSMEDIDEAFAGDIVALFGVDCVSGDTFSQSGSNYSMTSMHVPEPVISLALFPEGKKSEDIVAKALNRFTKEDPTFKSHVDPESNEIIIEGMGELHLDVYLERIKREYKATFTVGKPQVAYRETVSEAVNFDYTHKKQTGGAGQYARVCGTIEPFNDAEFEFVDGIKCGTIPAEYIPSCEKGFKSVLDKGSLIGFPVVNLKITVNDGAYHPVDSSDMAFQNAAAGAFRSVYSRAVPQIIEPIMTVSVESPAEFQGSVIGGLNKRRGIITGTFEDDNFTRIEAEVPLAEMFFYTSSLRSATEGKAEFTMEFKNYSRVPSGLQEQLIKEFAEKKKADKKT